MHRCWLAFIGSGPGGWELIVVFVAVLLLFGSKRLPEIARTLGRIMDEFRRTARSVTDELMYADHTTERLDPIDVSPEETTCYDESAGSEMPEDALPQEDMWSSEEAVEEKPVAEARDVADLTSADDAVDRAADEPLPASEEEKAGPDEQ